MPNRLLLAACGALEAVISGIYLMHYAQRADFIGRSSVVWMGRRTLAAGLCAIAAGLWRSRKSAALFLVANGLALSTLGLILTFIFGSRISFRTIALLISVAALSAGISEFLMARAVRRQHQLVHAGVLNLAGAVSIGFAAAFFALAVHWLKIEPRSFSDLLWLGSYFGFNAICALGLAVSARSIA